MREKTPRARGACFVDALITWMTPERQLGPRAQPLPGARPRRGRAPVDRNDTVTDSPTRTDPAAAGRQPSPQGRDPWPATSPSSTSRGEPPRARRRRWPRRASGLVSPASRARPGNGPPGCWRAIGGPPAAAAAARRAPSWRRTWPRVLATCHQPRRRGRGVESGDVSLKRGRLDAVIAGLLFHGGAAAQRGERPPLGRRRRGGGRRRGAGDGPAREDEPGGRGAGRAVREGRRRPSGRCVMRRARGPRTGWCRSRRRWWGCGSRRRPGRGAGDRPLGARRVWRRS